MEKVLRLKYIFNSIFDTFLLNFNIFFNKYIYNKC